MSSWPWPDEMVIRAVVVYKNSCSLQCDYKFHCALEKDLSECLSYVSTHGFYILGFQAMNAIGSRSVKSSSKKISRKGQTEEEGSGRDDMEITEVLVRDKKKVLSIEIDATVSVRIFNLRDYSQTDLFVRVGKIWTRTLNYTFSFYTVSHDLFLFVVPHAWTSRRQY